jgi:hypothetical protein
MKSIIRISLALLAAALIFQGCGGEESPAEADRAAIVDRVQEINTAVRERDGTVYCDLIEPGMIGGSGATFESVAGCVRETDSVLTRAGTERRLVVENIRMEDDDESAVVEFTDRPGEARFVKVDGFWYLSPGERGSSVIEATVPEGTTAG